MIGPQTPHAQELHATKYRDTYETFDDYCIRYARTVSESEGHFRLLLSALRDQRILPAGRQQLAVGRPYDLTALNCYVGGQIPDDSAGIMEELKRSMLTLRTGGGCGWASRPMLLVPLVSWVVGTLCAVLSLARDIAEGR